MFLIPSWWSMNPAGLSTRFFRTRVLVFVVTGVAFGFALGPSPARCDSGQSNGTADFSEPEGNAPEGKPPGGNTGENHSDTSQAEITRLIEGLASNSYATRIRCRDRLMRIGLAAFDQLRQARNHPDNEVAIVARRLTSGLRVQWSAPEDSSEVRELLSEYGSHSVTERRKRIQAIGDLARVNAFAPLLRLARFEAEPSLARTAAITLIRLETKHDDSRLSDATRQDLRTQTQLANLKNVEAMQIESMLGQQERIGSQWLSQYAADLRANELQIDAWATLIARNRQLLSPDGGGSESETEVSTSDLLELVWATAERASVDGQDNAATDLVVANVDLIPARTRDLMETATWALQHSLYRAVIAMHDAHKVLYRKSPILLYSAAEAYSRMQQDEEANGLAEIALEINPLPNLEAISGNDAPTDPAPANRAAPMHPQTIENNAIAHNEIASQLINRGLFHWAEKEYRLVIDRLPVDNTLSSVARLELAAMFAELLQHAGAIAVLSPLTERIERDDDFRNRLINRRFAYTSVQSELDFQRGLLMMQKGDFEAAKPVLRSAFEMNKKNIDILIAMYQLEGDEKWQKAVKQTLEEQISEAQSLVEDERNLMLRAGQFRRSGRDLATALNGYAWLICNTEGDTERALRYSRESLQLVPDSFALMDTCARCYYAVGDLEGAVAMQAKACEQMPHSPPLQRQLDEFREALSQSQSKSE